MFKFVLDWEWIKKDGSEPKEQVVDREKGWIRDWDRDSEQECAELKASVEGVKCALNKLFCR